MGRAILNNIQPNDGHVPADAAAFKAVADHGGLDNPNPYPMYRREYERRYRKCAHLLDPKYQILFWMKMGWAVPKKA